MQTKKLIPFVMILPLLVSCGGNKTFDELVIPTVDVDSIVPVLPTRPNYNNGSIRSDESNDYIDIYEISDFHGCVNEEQHSDGNYIGLPKLADYLNKKREINAGGTVVVSSGDMFQGSAESNLTRGYMVNYAMNYMGFDAMAIGNHEFDWTDSWLSKNANLLYKDHKMPFISANIVKTETNTTPEYLTKSTIVNRGEYKIGIVGSIGETLKSSILKSCIDGYEFTNEVNAVNEEAKRLKEVEGCNAVILTSHNDLDDLNSKNFQNIDAIFGGHSHISKNAMFGGTIPAAQTKNNGVAIAHIELAIDKATKTVVSGTANVDERPTNFPGLTDDKNIVTIMDNYTNEISKIKDIELGVAEDDLLIKNGLKNICVEAMYQEATKAIKDLELGISEDQILATFHNVEGGIRKDIKKGKITYGDVYAPFPFDNEVVLYKVKGSDFVRTMSQFASLGVRRTFASKSDIETNKDYYLVLSDFIALSTAYVGRIFPITENDLIRTGKIVREGVANLIYKTKTIKSADFSSSKSPYIPIPLI